EGDQAALPHPVIVVPSAPGLKLALVTAFQLGDHAAEAFVFCARNGGVHGPTLRWAMPMASSHAPAPMKPVIPIAKPQTTKTKFHPSSRYICTVMEMKGAAISKEPRTR